MGVFDRLKQASGTVAGHAAAAAGNLWQQYGDTISDKITSFASDIATLGKPVVADDARFTAHVNDRLWKVMPLPIRLLGRKRLQFDRLLLGIRDQIFVIEGDVVRVRNDARDRIRAVLQPVLNRAFKVDEFLPSADD